MDNSLTELIIYRGNRDVSVESTSERCYVYSIGSGRVKSTDFIDLNNSKRLNLLSQEVRDSYTEWVYSLNDQYLKTGLCVDDLSLFFLTDLSCKRSELFDIYDNVCNLLLLRERLATTQAQ